MLDVVLKRKGGYQKSLAGSLSADHCDSLLSWNQTIPTHLSEYRLLEGLNTVFSKGVEDLLYQCETRFSVITG